VGAAELNEALIAEVAGRMELPLPARVADAFRAVPRHVFVPNAPLEVAYEDVAILIKDERGEPRSSSSQPTIMAIMLAQLDVREGQRVLEIGTGTGYNAALLAELVGPNGRVVTIDLDGELVEAARPRLAGRPVEVVEGDGAGGHAPGAPYDRLIATAAVWDVPAAWREQLAPDGRIAMPLMIRGAQVCVAFRREGDRLESDSIVQGGFMPLRGSSGRPHATLLALGERGSLVADFPAVDSPPIPERTLDAWLHGAWAETATRVLIEEKEALFRLDHWLALREASYCRLRAHGDDAEHDLLPPLPAHPTPWRTSYGCGLADERGLALLAVADPEPAQPSPVRVRAYGDGDAIAARLVEHVEAWAAAGLGASVPSRIAILPRGAEVPPGATVLPRRESVVVVE
jgi:protein-L-isoaspartate(D-aspartate) O-methyltransferase